MHIDEEFQIVEERQHCITALAVQSFVHDAEEGGILSGVIPLGAIPRGAGMGMIPLVAKMGIGE